MRLGSCFYCSRAGHQVKDCWLKNRLCMRCGATGHVMKNCTGDPSQLTADCGTPYRGRNARARACTHCGRTDHWLKNCWKWNGWCLRCGAPAHSVKNCPERQGAVPTRPLGNSDAAAGPSQQGGKGIMRGTNFFFHSYLHHT
ncbi:zf-CCHC domain-containing protein/zf-CCHC_4 domain-containing protein [Cephalotus follicularis]|uniref:Zf-CCHC domain-containing protein/zf-CCHC_4 domain-containing protein n=1 Tax=Cephalotus follicularis TaxID=3775 RepID=A0A1Q3D5J5_CEPFO|nr:zf-CCHC domain-containing protein/zf-CCHC_4 domain-containing protein [Cephalotus follicularis]